MLFINRFTNNQSQSTFLKIVFFLNNVQRSGIKQLSELISELPKEPKRPMSVFFRYLAAVKPQLIQQYPNLPPTHIAKVAAEMWKKCDQNEKKPFENEFKKDWKKYILSVDSYKSTLSEDDKLALMSIEIKIQNEEEKKKLKKKLNELGKPKRPTYPFGCYLSERKTERNIGTRTPREWVKQMANEWKNMSNEEKEKYIEKSRMLSREYAQKLVQWKEKVGNVCDIHENLVTNEKMNKKSDKKR